MNKMIVAMDYTQDGSRTIASIHFGHKDYDELMYHATTSEMLEHDEVYISDFNPNDVLFIEEIVNNAKRID